MGASVHNPKLFIYSITANFGYLELKINLNRSKYRLKPTRFIGSCLKNSQDKCIKL